MLLVDDHVKGLQVRSPDGEWIIIDPVPDASSSMSATRSRYISISIHNNI
jgi:hypothetical protein